MADCFCSLSLSLTHTHTHNNLHSWLPQFLVLSTCSQLSSLGDDELWMFYYNIHYCFFFFKFLYYTFNVILYILKNWPHEFQKYFLFVYTCLYDLIASAILHEENDVNTEQLTTRDTGYEIAQFQQWKLNCKRLLSRWLANTVREVKCPFTWRSGFFIPVWGPQSSPSNILHQCGPIRVSLSILFTFLYLIFDFILSYAFNTFS